MKIEKKRHRVNVQDSTAKLDFSEVIEQILGEIVRLGRFSPCGEMRSGSLAVMNDSKHLSLIENGAQVAENRSYEPLGSAMREYLSAVQ